SGTVPLSESRFVAADDEDNVLRLYDADRGGPPLARHDISAALGVPLKGKKRPRPAEMDLESATRLGDHAYWLTSHGRNKKGKAQPARLRFFATTVRAEEAFEVAGHGYEDLIDDLARDPRLAGFDLAEAATRPPKADGGLAIEGLTATPEGHLMLAFRNPIPGGRALLVPLHDAARLVETPGAGPARFGDPVLLDLGGRGVRALSWWRGRYLIVAGHYADGGPSVLYTWDGRGSAREVTSIDLSAYNPEGFFTPEERDQIMVVSDDGERVIDGEACKELDDPARKRFRGVWITLPEAP
ncbi:MAG: DUF3616 domain-containing protein, partial [Deltaproteobacteria bacterium]|nr:DUF3616 domain-containing protein [Kofleriaceae bacterium]